MSPEKPAEDYDKIARKIELSRFKISGVTSIERYQQCNRCKIKLNVDRDEEIICLLCGETFCNSCIDKHIKDETKGL